jgi:hypothetical protein
MYRGEQRNGAHWSIDFVEHIRTVNFSLAAVCLALMGLLQFQKPRDVSIAEDQLREIRKLLDGWNGPEINGTITDTIKNTYALAGKNGISVSDEDRYIVLDGREYRLSAKPLISLKRPGAAAEWLKWLFDNPFKRPDSLLAFRQFCDYLIGA